MDRQDDLFRRERDREREERGKARKEKWARREKSFWRAFLFTEDGKPKSGLMIYTFCLSFLFLGLYIVAFFFAIDLLSAPLTGLPALWGNLIQSLIVSAVVAALGALLHVLLSDKRLVFGSYLWLSLYVAAAAIALMVILRDGEAIGVMLVFLLWFALIPLAVGLLTSWLLYRKDRKPVSRPEEEPEWKKYLHPR